MTDSQLSTECSPVWVVIPAAGSGQRMQSENPKQYLKINDKTILEHSIDCFIQHDQIAGIIIVLSSDDQYWPSINIQSNSLSKPIYTVEGGSDRSASVSQGLRYLEESLDVSNDSWVMVHDAARPCLTQRDLDSLLSIRKSNCVGGLLASSVKDTMKRASPNSLSVLHTESRENLWHALTPQMFRLGSLSDALKHCLKMNLEVTDESSAIEQIGEHPMIVECIDNNIKVTRPNDIALATFLLNEKYSKGEKV